MSYLKLIFVGLALTAASVVFAQGLPPPSMGGGPGGAASDGAGNVTGPGLGGNVASGNGAGGTSTSGDNVTVFRSGRGGGSGADHRGSGAPAAGAIPGAEAEPAAASECDQNAMQICRQQWDYCSDICTGSTGATADTCWTGCVNRYRHCKIASDCR